MQKYDVCRTCDFSRPAGKGEQSRVAIHSKGGDAIAVLIADKEELSAGIDTAMPGVRAHRGDFSDLCEASFFADGEGGDGIVETIRRIEMPSIGRDCNFRGKTRTGKTRRQRGGGLARVQRSG